MSRTFGWWQLISKTRKKRTRKSLFVTTTWIDTPLNFLNRCFWHHTFLRQLRKSIIAETCKRYRQTSTNTFCAPVTAKENPARRTPNPGTNWKANLEQNFWLLFLLRTIVVEADGSMLHQRLVSQMKKCFLHTTIINSNTITRAAFVFYNNSLSVSIKEWNSSKNYHTIIAQIKLVQNWKKRILGSELTGM